MMSKVSGAFSRARGRAGQLTPGRQHPITAGDGPVPDTGAYCKGA